MFSVCIALSSTVFAGGYFYSESGIVGLGRGGAWVAGADTQFAQLINPAGLVRIDRPTINAGLSQVQQKTTFERAKPDGGFFAPVENQAKPFLVPQLGFVTPLPHDLALAIGFYSPFAPSSNYKPNGAQRYSIIDSEVYVFNVGPSLAWRPIPQLSVGVGASWLYFLAEQSVKITVTGQDDPAGDILVGVDSKDSSTFSWNAGIILEPIPQIAIGASVTPPVTFEGSGQARIDFSDNGLATLLEETRYKDDVTLDVTLPLFLRFGIAVRPTEDLEVELAFGYQKWSMLEDLTVRDIDITLESESIILPEEDRDIPPTLDIPAGLRDSTAIRLGGEYRVIEPVEVRLGGFYETASVATRDMTVSLMDPPKWQVGGGGSLFLLDERLRLDLAFAVLLFPDLKLDNSRVTQIDAGIRPDLTTATIGNGKLTSSGWIFGSQLQWSFGRKEQDPA